MTRAIVTWISCLIAGTATMVALEYVLRDGDMSVVAPAAQGVGLWIALMLAYPMYYRHQANRQYGVWRYTVITTAPAILVTAVRIALRTG
jgi:hypothetical protein